MKHDILENQVNVADVKAIFKSATALKNKPSIFGKVFKGLRKDKLDVNDLQQAWKDEGFPDDTRDIKQLLLGHGFSAKEISKVFSNVFGDTADGEHDMSGSSPAVQKIADFIKKNDLADQVREFMKREYKFNESVEFESKVVVEDIRRIFSAIIVSERSERHNLLKEQEKKRLGRTKK